MPLYVAIVKENTSMPSIEPWGTPDSLRLQGLSGLKAHSLLATYLWVSFFYSLKCDILELYCQAFSRTGHLLTEMIICIISIDINKSIASLFLLKRFYTVNCED